MISPASFNYYLECIARAQDLYAKALKAQTMVEFYNLRKRSKVLLQEVPNCMLPDWRILANS